MPELDKLLDRIHNHLDRIEDKQDRWAEKMQPALTEIALLKAEARRVGKVHGWISGIISGIISAWVATKLFF